MRATTKEAIPVDRNIGIVERDLAPTDLLAIFDPSGQLVVRLSYDGSIEFGEGYVPETAAKRFWEYLSSGQETIAREWAKANGLEPVAEVPDGV